MKRTENAWARYRNIRLLTAGLGLLLAFLALVFPVQSIVGRGLLLASLSVAAILLLVLARRPDHEPTAMDIVLPIAIFGLVVLSALRSWH